MSDTGAGEAAGRGEEPEDDELPETALEDPFEELEGEDEFYEFPDDAEPHTALPTKVEAWRKRSATGAILTGFALGLQQVFEPKRDEPAVIMETSGDPPRDLPVEADFEYGRPRQSVVNVRPWLLPGAPDADPGPAGEAQQDNSGGSPAGSEEREV